MSPPQRSLPGLLQAQSCPSLKPDMSVSEGTGKRQIQERIGGGAGIVLRATPELHAGAGAPRAQG